MGAENPPAVVGNVSHMPQPSGDSEAWDDEPPPPTERTWMHPSEVGRMQDTLLAPSKRSFSVSTALVAGSLGAVAMFVLLAAAGMLDNDPPVARSLGIKAVDNETSQISPPATILEVKRTTDYGTVATAAFPIDDSGNIVTMSATDPAGSSISVETYERTYESVRVIGYDPTTHLAVLAVHDLQTQQAEITPSEPSDATVLVNAEALGHHKGVTVKDPTATVKMSDTRIWGLIAIDSMNAPTTSQALLSNDSDSIVGLVVPFDDDPNDHRYYALSAVIAKRVAHQLLAEETPTAGAIGDLDLAPSERIVSIGSTEIEDHDDLVSCLMGYEPGDSVTLKIDDGTKTYDVITTLDSSEDT